jgi:hypothetical protein
MQPRLRECIGDQAPPPPPRCSASALLHVQAHHGSYELRFGLDEALQGLPPSHPRAPTLAVNLFEETTFSSLALSGQKHVMNAGLCHIPIIRPAFGIPTVSEHVLSLDRHAMAVVVKVLAGWSRIRVCGGVPGQPNAPRPV